MIFDTKDKPSQNVLLSAYQHVIIWLLSRPITPHLLALLHSSCCLDVALKLCERTWTSGFFPCVITVSHQCPVSPHPVKATLFS